ncbi:MAG TPA: YbhB/YbcL family Raf kinase inhibitor-like protein [Candidatus Angelobacter sp.]|nr:YbhB/YbcL family Raf kinase inhibitor-like protein [Candidatus Angelobacter sp.]
MRQLRPLSPGLIPCVIAVLGLAAVGVARPAQHQSRRKESSMFQIKSSAFNAEGNIPSRFTCQGADISPALEWNGAPEGTKAFALVVHDPDAPRSGGFTHWVAYDIPPEAKNLPENVAKGEALPGGGTQGKNDFGKTGYNGPCPPSGTHRYYFRVYALDRPLNLHPGATKEELEKAIRGHVLAEAELMGKFSKASGRAA